MEIPGLVLNGNFRDYDNNGLYVTDNPTDLDEVRDLITQINNQNAAGDTHVNVRILTGTHGQQNTGNLFGERLFFQEDLQNEIVKSNGFVTVIDIRNLSRDNLRAKWAHNNSAVVLAWCYSADSYRNSSHIIADWPEF